MECRPLLEFSQCVVWRCSWLNLCAIAVLTPWHAGFLRGALGTLAALTREDQASTTAKEVLDDT
eukprot:12173220-Alexandrium_andersonii.AAC.1